MSKELEELDELIRQKRAALANIARAMQADGDSLRAIGAKLGVSYETVRKWLKRSQQPAEED